MAVKEPHSSRLLRAIFLPCLLLVTTSAWCSTNELELRLGGGEKDLARYTECGYNAAVLGGVTDLATYDTIAPGVIPKDSTWAQKVERQREKLAEKCRRAKELGIAVCISTDEIQLPILIRDHFQKSIARADKPSRIDFESEEFWNLYRAKYREVLKDFPDVAYVMVRTGENYSHLQDGLVGHTILEGKPDETYYRNMRRLIEETRKVVVDEFGRKLIWRTWDLGNNGFHANTNVYDHIVGGLTNRIGLILAVKFTQTDFWRYNDFNPCIGRGNIPQIIEYQCAREYEGKGAFPDYVGAEHATAMKKAAALGAKGVWIWDFGGGWGGPFIQSDRWVRLNIEATSRLAQNPDLSPRDLAKDWAAKEFGASAASKIADMVMLSPDCVQKCFYIAPYARNHKGWLPSRNLLRDDIIRGGKVLGDQGGLNLLYEGSKNAMDEVFQDKQEAVRIADRMREMLESAHDDIARERSETVYQESLSSVLYLEALTKVMSHYVHGMFLFYQWQETGEVATAKKARAELLEWRQEWRDYLTNIPKLPGVASLYRSQNEQPTDSPRGAMADTCEGALKALATRLDSVAD